MRPIDAYALQNEIQKSKMENPHKDAKVAKNHEFEHDHFMRMVTLQPTVKTRKELAKDAVVTDDPQTNIEVMMNLSYSGEDGQVWIRSGGEDGEDCTLVEMCRRMCKKCDQYEENPLEYADPEDFETLGDFFMDCSMDSCPVGHTYFIAIQAAELRERLRKYEDRDIEAEPVKDQHSRTGMGYEYHDWLCPSCRKFIAFEPDINGIPRRCQRCGQLLKKPGR